jgi:hypothetical protein
MNRLSIVLALSVAALTACAQQGGISGQPAGETLNPMTAPGRLASGNWIDKITEYVLTQQAVSKEGDYQLYFSELQMAKDARQRGDWAGQYEAMNRLIDKLDTRAGGITDKAARAIREYVYLVEPAGYHDLARDRKIHPEVQKWEARKARQREEVESPQSSS